MKKISLLIIMMMVMPIVLAGVTNPLPTELNLFKGEQGRFKFQIQTVASNQSLSCKVSLDKNYDFDVMFDEEELFVDAGTVKEIYGTVKVPFNPNIQTENIKFCLTCEPQDKTAGNSVAIQTCDLPLKVNVVNERKIENMTVPKRPWSLLEKSLMTLLIILIMSLPLHFRKR